MRCASNCLACWWSAPDESWKWNAECACACGTQTEGGTIWSAVAVDDGLARSSRLASGTELRWRMMDRQSRACARCRDDTVWCQATLLLLLIRTSCPSWCVVVYPVHEASWPGSRALIAVLMLSCWCAFLLNADVEWMNDWLSGQASQAKPKC